MMNRTIRNRAVRRLSLAALATTVAVTASCSVDQILEVSNPDQLDESLLDDATLVPVLVNGVIGDFNAAYSDPFIWRGSMLTDQQITGINWEQTARLSQRIVQFDEGDADLMFSELSRARQQGDSITGRLRTLLDSPSSDPLLATTLIYAGFSSILLGDAMCESVVDVGTELQSSTQMYERAVTRLDEGLTVALAAGDDDLANLARVGLTRAHLNLGNTAQVMAIAPDVPDDFEALAEYSETDDRVYNIMEARVTGSNHSLGVHPRFLAGGNNEPLFGTQDLEVQLTDPRIQHLPQWRLGHNRLTWLYTPKQGLMYDGYNGETFADGGSPPDYARGTDIKFATGLDARHNFYEAMGPTPETLTFVNERRAVGNQDPVDLSGDALMAELRDQRGRDFFLSGRRLGDLRRWLAQGIDMFPSGTHPTEQWGAYGSATCFPLPLEEYEGNPNLTTP